MDAYLHRRTHASVEGLSSRLATSAVVVRTDPDDNRVLLDRTVFYPGGGGQPHDAGDVVILHPDDTLVEGARVEPLPGAPMP